MQHITHRGYTQFHKVSFSFVENTVYSITVSSGFVERARAFWNVFSSACEVRAPYLFVGVSGLGVGHATSSGFIMRRHRTTLAKGDMNEAIGKGAIRHNCIGFFGLLLINRR